MLDEREYDLLISMLRERIIGAMDDGISNDDPSSIFRTSVYDKLIHARAGLTVPGAKGFDGTYYHMTAREYSAALRRAYSDGSADMLQRWNHVIDKMVMFAEGRERDGEKATAAVLRSWIAQMEAAK